MNYLRENFLTRGLLKMPLEQMIFWSIVVIYALIRLLFVFSTRVGLEIGEEDNLWNILQILDGRTIYTNPAEKPFEIFLYPPISQLAYAWVIKILAIKNIYWMSVVLRGLSLCCNLGTVLIIRTFMVKTLGHNQAKYINWLILTALATMIHLNWTIRVDALSVLFSVFLIVYCVNRLTDFDFKSILFASFLINISIFTKQDGIQFIGILPVALILIRKLKEGIFLFLVSIFLLILSCFVADIIWGQNFYDSVIGGVSNPLSLSNAFDVINRYFQLYSLLPILIISFAIWGVIRFESETDQFLSIVVIGTFSFACVTSMKFGAWVNYFTLFNLLGIILLSRGIHYIRRFDLAVLTIICFLFYFISGHVYHYLTPEFSLDKKELTEKKVLSERIRKMLPSDKFIYTNDDILELYLHDRTIFPNQIFYNGMCTYKHNLSRTLINNIVLIKREENFDYVEDNLLDFDKKNVLKIDLGSNYCMYRIGSKTK
jgi:hypothetical protein